AVDVGLDHPLLVVLARLPERVAADRTAGVVDEDVEPAEGLERAVEEALAARGVGDVQLVNEVAFEALDSARADRDLDAVLAQQPRGRGADPRGRARDDRGLSVERRHGDGAYRRNGDRRRNEGPIWTGPRACSTCSVECSSPNRAPSIDSRSLRIAWQSAPTATSTWAETIGNPLVSVQTWRSCTSTTSGSSRIARPTVSGWMFSGATSRKIRVDSRSSPKAPQNISAATTSPAIGSNRSHPVARIRPPTTAVPANAARSVTTCRNAPRTFRLSRLALANSAVATRLTAMPPSATARTIPPWTSPGETRRLIAPNTIQMPTSRSARPFACAARISSRLKPYVQRPAAGRAAIVAAAAAKPRAATSEIRCPASASRANDPARIPATISPTIRPAISTSAATSRRRSPSFRCVWPCIARRLTGGPETASTLG